ncbi:hypothetical protein RI129_008088 [Pyrocoelia pectoralis]|uniref:Uncharacterized protein n=1 Tax=Pyrocoelia pectoralis TaxID=417401 RepID=A0AAN7ZM53_9COLE
MAQYLIRFVTPLRQTLVEVLNKLSDSEISKELLEKCGEMTSFIQFEENMLLTINSKQYEIYGSNDVTHLDKTFVHISKCDPAEQLNVLSFMKDVGHTFHINETNNLLGNQLYQHSQLFRRIRHPLTIFRDDLLDKTKPNNLYTLGMQSYATYNLLCGGLQKNFYGEKENKNSNKLLKCHYVLYSTDNKKHLTVRYLDPSIMNYFAREIVRQLLDKSMRCLLRKRMPLNIDTLVHKYVGQVKQPADNNLMSKRNIHYICTTSDDLHERKNIIEINQKVFEEVEKELDYLKVFDKSEPKEVVDENQPNQKHLMNKESSNALMAYVPQMLMPLTASNQQEPLNPINLYNKPPHYFKKKLQQSILPNQHTFWNVHISKFIKEAPKVEKPRKYKYSDKEIKSSLGTSRITYLIPVDE